MLAKHRLNEPLEFSYSSGREEIEPVNPAALAHTVARPDERVLIEQGLEMKRPSRIFVCASREDNRVVNVRVGGHAVEVLRAEILL